LPFYTQKSTVFWNATMWKIQAAVSSETSLFTSHTALYCGKFQSSLLGLSKCSKEITWRHTTEDRIVKINCSVYPAL